MTTLLFSAPDSFARRALDYLYPVLDAVMPMTGQQRRDLPMACRDLSAMLTTEREGMTRHYWASPRLTSAYLRYFLPWNLVRLSALLPSLNFGRIPEEPLILDIGSGPFTLPMALWISRPDLRYRRVTVVGSDIAPHILELGRSIFEKLTESLGEKMLWSIRTMRAPVSLAPRRLYAKPGDLWLACMGNVLNEMEDRRVKPGHRMSERMRALLESLWGMLGENGQIFAVEPGTRQGGRLMAHLRKSALGGAEEEEEDLTAFALKEEQAGRLAEDDQENDNEEFCLPPLFTPNSPCTHAGPCPMLDRRSTAWCHVNAPAEGAPEALRSLSASAGLNKDSISLSFLSLRKLNPGELPPKEHTQVRVRARIISDAFVLPGHTGRARYACAAKGLCLIPNSAHLPSGALCTAFSTKERDMKSRAVILTLEEKARPVRGDRENMPARQKHAASPGREKTQKEQRTAPFRKQKDSPKRSEKSRGSAGDAKKRGRQEL